MLFEVLFEIPDQMLPQQLMPHQMVVQSYCASMLKTFKPAHGVQHNRTLSVPNFHTRLCAFWPTESFLNVKTQNKMSSSWSSVFKTLLDVLLRSDATSAFFCIQQQCHVSNCIEKPVNDKKTDMNAAFHNNAYQWKWDFIYGQLHSITPDCENGSQEMNQRCGNTAAKRLQQVWCQT